MKANADVLLEQLVADSLRSHLSEAVRRETDLWQDLQPVVLRRASRATLLKAKSFRARAATFSLVCAAVVAVSLSRAGAAPHLSDAQKHPQSWGAIVDDHGDLGALSPMPAFGLWRPTYRPRQLNEHLFSWGVVAATTGYPTLDPPDLRALAASDRPVLFMGYSNSSNSLYLEIMERQYPDGKQLPRGKEVALGTRRALLRVSGSVQSIDFLVSDRGVVRWTGTENVFDPAVATTTLVTIKTNLGEAEAVKVGESLTRKIDPVDPALWPTAPRPTVATR